MFHTVCSIINNKDDLNKENLRIKTSVKKLGIKKKLFVNSSRELIGLVTKPNTSHRYKRRRGQNEYKFTLNQKHWMETLIHMQMSQDKILTEQTLQTLHGKLIDWLAAEDKKSIVYELHCNYCETAYFGESKPSWQL